MNEVTFYVVYCHNSVADNYSILYEGASQRTANIIKGKTKGAEVSIYPPFCYVPDKEPSTITASYKNRPFA